MILRKHLQKILIAGSFLVAFTLVLSAPIEHTRAQAQTDGRLTSQVTPTPSPQPFPNPRTIDNPPRTIAELLNRIGEVVHQPALEPGFFAVKIVSLDTGGVIYEQNANKFVRPASNMKLYTVAAAFDRLTPDYHFSTSVYAKEKVEDGKIKGDLIIYGRGDPSLAARFNNSDYFKGINNLAERIVAAGVKRVKGDLVGDESYFNGDSLGSGWEWDDLLWSYGAQVSALNVNDNGIDLTVKPAEKVGAPVVVTSGPPATFMTIANRAITGPRESKSDLNIYRGLGANTLEISGSLPIGRDSRSCLSLCFNAARRADKTRREDRRTLADGQRACGRNHRSQHDYPCDSDQRGGATLPG